MKVDQNMAGFFAFKKNLTTFNLRIGVFPQFVTFKFNVNPYLALSNRLPNLLGLSS